MKKKIIIFGFGYNGKNAYQRLKKDYDIVAFADNNAPYGKISYESIPVIKGCEVRDVYTEGIDIVICSRAYFDIASQLMEMDIFEYYVMLEGFLYHCDLDEMMAPVELNEKDYYKNSFGERNILFVQNTACSRTHKIAETMKGEGYQVFLLYVVAPPYGAYEDCEKIYDDMWGFTSANGICDFIDNSDFDIVHCSNEPDILVNIIQQTNKPVVADTHDMQSIRGEIDIETLVLEYLANVESDGNIYVSENIANIAQKKYRVREGKIFAFENYVIKEAEIGVPKQKLSTLDGEIHCVYEGAVVGNDKMHHRYFDDFWKKITDEGFHIHFYSGSEYSLCKRLEEISPLIHYEGSLSGEKLIYEMTQYDCGLALFNVNDGNQMHLEGTSINKIYEYANAGLPILSHGIRSLEELLKQFGIGYDIDFGKEIRVQIEEAIKIDISCEFLSKNHLTMKSNASELAKFYEKIKGVTLENNRWIV